MNRVPSKSVHVHLADGRGDPVCGLGFKPPSTTDTSAVTCGRCKQSGAFKVAVRPPAVEPIGAYKNRVRHA